jgi:hypothetical protein
VAAAEVIMNQVLTLVHLELGELVVAELEVTVYLVLLAQQTLVAVAGVLESMTKLQVEALVL